MSDCIYFTNFVGNVVILLQTYSVFQAKNRDVISSLRLGAYLP